MRFLHNWVALREAGSFIPSSVLSPTPVLDVQSPLNAQINLKLQNILMLLKRCCNHPYLVEYPLDPATQEFKVTHRAAVLMLLPVDVVWRKTLSPSRTQYTVSEQMVVAVGPGCFFTRGSVCRLMSSWCRALGSFLYWTGCCLL